MKRVALMALLLAAPWLTAGPTRKERSERKGAERTLREFVRPVAKTCGLPKLKMEVDWASFQGKPREGLPIRTAAALCGTVADGLSEWCGEREPKTGLDRQMATLRCVYRREAIRFQAERKAKTIRVYFSRDTANLADEMNAWLKKEFPPTCPLLGLRKLSDAGGRAPSGCP